MMLGICWSPSAVQGLQKMASTFPSNPEQLLGAILVRQDIFHRFETTMRDTYMDANDLLEYLFSLYNRMAAPAEGVKCPISHNQGCLDKDKIQQRKDSHDSSYIYQGQHITDSSQVPQPLIQCRISESREHPTSPAEGHRKNIKTEQNNLQRKENFSQRVFGQAYHTNFSSQDTFPGANGSRVKVQLAADRKPQQTQSASPLPPFSQICHQGRPYSPGSSQQHFNTASLHEDHHIDFHQVSASESSISIKTEVQEFVGSQQAEKCIPGVAKPKKLKGCDGGSTSGNENTGRKKKKHQCFCGALFTRADNLKRHIRKCHEEKQKKLCGTDVDEGDAPAADFPQQFSSSSQERLDTSEEQELHQLQVHSSLQQQQDKHVHHDVDLLTNVPKMRWSCFCGESYDDHHKLMEHTRTHESNT